MADIGRPVPFHAMMPMMTKLATLFALPALLLATPSQALSLTAAQLGDIYCYARLSGDMAPVLAILTPELSALVAAHLPPGADAATAIPWQSSADYANTCMSVGSSGTFDAPEIVIAFGYRDPNKPGYADKLVLRFVDQRIRIDDIAYGASGTLREKLAASP